MAKTAHQRAAQKRVMIECLPLPPRAELCQLLDYNAQTGDLVWQPGRKRAGKMVGWVNTGGYRQVKIKGTVFLTHRLIWKMVHGVDPEFVDHQDGDRTNNKISNLRSIEFGENHKNCRMRKDNKSGVSGVSWFRATESWMVYIRTDGKQKYIGLFDDLDQAAAARKAAEIKYGFHPNHGREA